VPFTLSTTSFTVGEPIPAKYTCDGPQVSPQLAWEINSTAVKSFALVVDDPDGIPIVGYAWAHWNVYQIPAGARQIPEGASLTSAMPAGSLEGTNHDGVAKYSGPCPPAGTGVHHYVFAIYALNVASLDVNLGRALNRSAFEAQYASAILQKVEINAVYGQ
jgi:Raf kinase inhibitor-like YbhB/YbcL family protein